MGNGVSGREAPTKVERVVLNPEVMAQRVDDELVLVHLGTNQIYSLNSSAARLWELLASGLELSEARNQLAEEFEVSLTRLEGDIRVLLESLAEKNLIFFERMK